MSLALLLVQHVSNASTFIFKSLRLCVGKLLWFDVCWRYGVVRLGWSGILMQAEAHLMSLALLFHYLLLSLFTAQHVSNVSTSIFRSLRLIVDLFRVLYCSGSMCVGVTVWFGWGGVVSLCRLKQCFSLHKVLYMCTICDSTGLFLIIVTVLTTCHAQYTSDSSICVFVFNRTTLPVSVTYLTGALYVHPLSFYMVIQNDCRGFNKLSCTIHFR